MEREFDAYKYYCLAACAHLTITVCGIEQDICEKIVILSYPLHSTPPLGGFPSEYCHPVRCGKTRMVGLPDVEKTLRICVAVWAQYRRVTDRRIDTHLATAYTRYAYASRSKNKSLQFLSFDHNVSETVGDMDIIH